MDELIMVTDANWINEKFGESDSSVISMRESDFLNAIESHYRFLERSIVENDLKFKQIVSYCFIVCGEELFITRRTTRQTEKRLHNQYSFGVGGHINIYDGNRNPVVEGMLRELFEEVDIQCKYDCDFIGIINDNSTEVNSVHTGVCYLIRLDEKLCRVKETEKMKGFWIDKSAISQYMDGLERWSAILINSLLSRKQI